MKSQQLHKTQLNKAGFPSHPPSPFSTPTNSMFTDTPKRLRVTVSSARLTAARTPTLQGELPLSSPSATEKCLHNPEKVEAFPAQQRRSDFTNETAASTLAVTTVRSYSRNSGFIAIFLFLLVHLLSPFLLSFASSCSFCTSRTVVQSCNPTAFDMLPTSNFLLACRDKAPISVDFVSNSITELVPYDECGGSTFIRGNPQSSVVYVGCQSGLFASDGGFYFAIDLGDCTMPSGLTLNYDFTTAYVACGSGGAITLDLVNYNFTRIVTSQECSSATSIAPSLLESPSSLVYLSCWNSPLDRVLQFPQNRRVTDVAAKIWLETGSCPIIKAIDVQGKDAVVAACGGGVDGIVQRTAGGGIRRITAKQCLGASWVFVDEDDTIWAACFSGLLIAIDARGYVYPMLSTSQCGNPIFVRRLFGVLYVACYADTAVIAVGDASILTQADAQSCPNPDGVSVTRNGEVVFVACNEGDSLVVTSGATVASVLTSSSICASAYSIFAAPDSLSVKIGCYGTGVLSVAVNGSSAIDAQTIVNSTICSVPYAMWVDRFGTTLAACRNQGVISITSDGYVRTLADFQTCTDAIDVQSDEVGRVFMACAGSATLMMDANATSPREAVSTSVCASSIAVRHDSIHSVLYVACTGGFLVVIRGSMELNSTSLVSPISLPLCQEISFLWLNQNTSVLSIACGNGRVLSLFNGTNAANARSILEPGVCITPSSLSGDLNGVLYVSCRNGVIALNPPRTCPGGGQYFFAGICYPCPINTYRDAQDVTSSYVSCVKCPRGTTTLQRTGSTACVPCGTGQYESSGICYACKVGTYQSLAGQSSCIACAKGSVTPSSGRTSCTNCTAGQYQSGSQLVCSSCAPGRYQNRTRQTTCIACEVGFVAPEDGSTACAPCPAGSAQFRQSCPSCAPGRFSASVASVNCTDCPAGRFSPTLGSSDCQPCANGLSQSANSGAATTCICPENYQYSAKDGCSVCPLGKSSAAGGVCSPCPEGSYTPTQGASCRSCAGVAGLTCSGGMAFIARDYFPLRLSEIQSDKVASTSTSAEVVFFSPVSCPPDVCPGGLLPDARNTSSTETICEWPRVNSLDNLLCARCEEGFVPWGLNCFECTGPDEWLIATASLITAAEVFLVLVRDPDSSSSSIDVLIYFLQTVALEIGPESRYLSWLQFLNLGTRNAPRCIAPFTPFQQMVLDWFMPIGLFGIIGAFAIVHTVIAFIITMMIGSKPHISDLSGSQPDDPLSRTVDTSRATDQELNSKYSNQRAKHNSSACRSRCKIILQDVASSCTWNRYLAGLVGVLLYSYTSVCVSAVGFFYCIDVGSNRRMYMSPTIECSGEEYSFFSIAAWLTIFLYLLGFPLLAVVLVGWNQAMLASPTASATQFRQRWGGLYTMYHPRAWFWQAITLLRRALFALVAVFFANDRPIRFMLFTLLNFFSLIMQIEVRPFITDGVNALASFSYGILVCMSVLLTSFTPPYPSYIQGLLLGLLLITICWMAVPTVREIWRDLEDQWNIHATDSTTSSTVPTTTMVGKIPEAPRLNSAYLTHMEQLRSRAYETVALAHSKGERVELAPFRTAAVSPLTNSPSAKRFRIQYTPQSTASEAKAVDAQSLVRPQSQTISATDI